MFIWILIAALSASDYGTLHGSPNSDFSSVATLVSPIPCVISAAKGATIMVRIDGKDSWWMGRPYDGSLTYQTAANGAVTNVLQAIPGALITQNGKSYVYKFIVPSIVLTSVDDGSIVVTLATHHAAKASGAYPGTSYRFEGCRLAP